LADEKLDIDRIRRLLATARRDAPNLACSSLEPALRQRFETVLDRWANSPFDSGKLEKLEALVSLAQVPPIHFELWQAQNVYYELSQAILCEQHLQVSPRWLDLFQKLGELLGVAVADALLARLTSSPAVEAPHPASTFVREAVLTAPHAALMSLDEIQRRAGLEF
jgi:hypothetical protein